MEALGGLISTIELRAESSVEAVIKLQPVNVMLIRAVISLYIISIRPLN